MRKLVAIGCAVIVALDVLVVVMGCKYLKLQEQNREINRQLFMVSDAAEMYMLATDESSELEWDKEYVKDKLTYALSEVGYN